MVFVAALGETIVLDGRTESGRTEARKRSRCRILLLAVRAAVREGGSIGTKFSWQGIGMAGSGLVLFVIGILVLGMYGVTGCLRLLYWSFKVETFFFGFWFGWGEEVDEGLSFSRGLRSGFV